MSSTSAPFPSRPGASLCLSIVFWLQSVIAIRDQVQGGQGGKLLIISSFLYYTVLFQPFWTFLLVWACAPFFLPLPLVFPILMPATVPLLLCLETAPDQLSPLQLSRLSLLSLAFLCQFPCLSLLSSGYGCRLVGSFHLVPPRSASGLHLP